MNHKQTKAILKKQLSDFIEKIAADDGIRSLIQSKKLGELPRLVLSGIMDDEQLRHQFASDFYTYLKNKNYNPDFINDDDLFNAFLQYAKDFNSLYSSVSKSSSPTAQRIKEYLDKNVSIFNPYVLHLRSLMSLSKEEQEMLKRFFLENIRKEFQKSRPYTQSDSTTKPVIQSSSAIRSQDQTLPTSTVQDKNDRNVQVSQSTESGQENISSLMSLLNVMYSLIAAMFERMDRGTAQTTVRSKEDLANRLNSMLNPELKYGKV